MSFSNQVVQTHSSGEIQLDLSVLSVFQISPTTFPEGALCKNPCSPCSGYNTDGDQVMLLETWDYLCLYRKNRQIQTHKTHARARALRPNKCRAMYMSNANCDIYTDTENNP